MTIPPPIKKVAELVMGMFPQNRNTLSRAEMVLAVHLRGNQALYDALVGIVRERMAGRASVPEPSDPLAAKSMIARDRELQWLLGRFESTFTAPVPSLEHDGEQPA